MDVIAGTTSPRSQGGTATRCTLDTRADHDLRLENMAADTNRRRVHGQPRRYRGHSTGGRHRQRGTSSEGSGREKSEWKWCDARGCWWSRTRSQSATIAICRAGAGHIGELRGQMPGDDFMLHASCDLTMCIVAEVACWDTIWLIIYLISWNPLTAALHLWLHQLI